MLVEGINAVINRSRQGILVLLTVFVAACSGVLAGGELHHIRALAQGRTVEFELPPGTDRVVRSTSICSEWGFKAHDPVREFKVYGRSFRDEEAAHNTIYHYACYAGGELLGWTAVRTDNLWLGPLYDPVLWVDKNNYTLTVFDGDQVAKVYPIAMGKKPKNRKLHQDNASTPEGFYQIYGTQPEATFYRAYDIDYPNDVDKIRYDFARSYLNIPNRGIGGEIQIHGEGIHRNWTWGCMALRNDDMDELFSRPEIGRGTQVLITGNEISWEDLESIVCEWDPGKVLDVQQRLLQLGYDPGDLDGKMGRQTRVALGRFQLKRRLPCSLQLDCRTMKALGF